MQTSETGEAVGGSGTAGEAFRIEARGLDYVPRSERWARPRDLFGMWAGASVNIEYFIYGAILMTFGFSFYEALSLIIIGNLTFFLLGLTSLQGPQAGTTTFAVNRAAYGPHGTRVISLFNWLTQIGFEVEGIILITGAGLVLAIKAGFSPGKPAEVIMLIIAVIIQAVLPLLGHATMVKTLRWLVVPFIVIFLILLGFSIGHTDMGVKTASFAHGWQFYMVGLAFTIALSGLGWTENGNDYSRYCPEGSSRKSIVGWVFLGTAVPEILCMILGAVVGTFLTTIGTSANAFLPFAHQSAIPAAFVVVLLLFSILQLFAINSLDLYSSGVSLLALGLKVKRYQAVLIDSALCILVGLIAILNSSFKTYLSDFVAAVICWISAWCGIFLVDWILRKYRYVPAELQKTDRSSIYWEQGGVNWAAIFAQTCGIVASVLALDQLFYVGPIAKALAFGGAQGADMSVFTGFFGGALVYAIVGSVVVRRQSRVQEEMLSANVTLSPA
ncbi:MAG: purine-cytosine permease family protein [Acidimicrobiales bacterium]